MRIFNSVTASALTVPGFGHRPRGDHRQHRHQRGRDLYGSRSWDGVGRHRRGRTKLPAQQSTVKYSTKAGVTSGFGNYARATSTVVYDDATDTYTIRDTGSLSITSSFAPANVSSSDATFTNYSKDSGNETFRLLNKGGAESADPAHLCPIWRMDPQLDGQRHDVGERHLSGLRRQTPKAAIPTSGSASYSTVYDGNSSDKDGAHALDGTGSMTAHFDTHGLDYTATINGAPSGSLAFAGSGSISARTGDITTSQHQRRLQLHPVRQFLWPAAEEVGGLFRLWNRTSSGQGAFVGNCIHSRAALAAARRLPQLSPDV